MYKTGWLRELTDVRDYDKESPKIAEVYKPLAVAASSKIDLREFFTPVENQGDLGSCTAHAGTAILEYYERRAFKNYVNASRLFLYKVTRKLAKLSGDSGAELRNTMQALVMFGAPPEEYCPYNVAKYDAEPDAFLYALADDYRATSYFRHDPAGQTDPNKVLASLKESLAKGIPVMFGTTVYNSFPGLGAPNNPLGRIPFPGQRDKVAGGHAMVLVGYDDTTSEFLIRNSWGTSWGDKGYGRMPYTYVTSRLATDFWSLLHAEFTDLTLFA